MNDEFNDSDNGVFKQPIIRLECTNKSCDKETLNRWFSTVCSILQASDVRVYRALKKRPYLSFIVKGSFTVTPRVRLRVALERCNEQSGSTENANSFKNNLTATEHLIDDDTIHFYRPSTVNNSQLNNESTLKRLDPLLHSLNEQTNITQEKRNEIQPTRGFATYKRQQEIIESHNKSFDTRIKDSEGEQSVAVRKEDYSTNINVKNLKPNDGDSDVSEPILFLNEDINVNIPVVFGTQLYFMCNEITNNCKFQTRSNMCREYRHNQETKEMKEINAATFLYWRKRLLSNTRQPSSIRLTNEDCDQLNNTKNCNQCEKAKIFSIACPLCNLSNYIPLGCFMVSGKLTRLPIFAFVDAKKLHYNRRVNDLCAFFESKSLLVPETIRGEFADTIKKWCDNFSNYSLLLPTCIFMRLVTNAVDAFQEPLRSLKLSYYFDVNSSTLRINTLNMSKDLIRKKAKTSSNIVKFNETFTDTCDNTSSDVVHLGKRQQRNNESNNYQLLNNKYRNIKRSNFKNRNNQRSSCEPSNDNNNEVLINSISPISMPSTSKSLRRNPLVRKNKNITAKIIYSQMRTKLASRATELAVYISAGHVTTAVSKNTRFKITDMGGQSHESDLFGVQQRDINLTKSEVETRRGYYRASSRYLLTSPNLTAQMLFAPVHVCKLVSGQVLTHSHQSLQTSMLNYFCVQHTVDNKNAGMHLELLPGVKCLNEFEVYENNQDILNALQAAIKLILRKYPNIQKDCCSCQIPAQFTVADTMDVFFVENLLRKSLVSNCHCVEKEATVGNETIVEKESMMWDSLNLTHNYGNDGGSDRDTRDKGALRDDHITKETKVCRSNEVENRIKVVTSLQPNNNIVQCNNPKEIKSNNCPKNRNINARIVIVDSKMISYDITVTNGYIPRMDLVYLVAAYGLVEDDDFNKDCDSNNEVDINDDNNRTYEHDVNKKISSKWQCSSVTCKEPSLMHNSLATAKTEMSKQESQCALNIQKSVNQNASQVLGNIISASSKYDYMNDMIGTQALNRVEKPKSLFNGKSLRLFEMYYKRDVRVAIVRSFSNTIIDERYSMPPLTREWLLAEYNEIWSVLLSPSSKHNDTGYGNTLLLGAVASSVALTSHSATAKTTAGLCGIRHASGFPIFGNNFFNEENIYKGRQHVCEFEESHVMEEEEDNSSCNDMNLVTSRKVYCNKTVSLTPNDSSSTIFETNISPKKQNYLSKQRISESLNEKLCKNSIYSSCLKNIFFSQPTKSVCYPQNDMCRTGTSSVVPYQLAFALVSSLAGDNVEDGIVVSKAARDRGFGMTSSVWFVTIKINPISEHLLIQIPDADGTFITTLSINCLKGTVCDGNNCNLATLENETYLAPNLSYWYRNRNVNEGATLFDVLGASSVTSFSTNLQFKVIQSSTRVIFVEPYACGGRDGSLKVEEITVSFKTNSKHSRPLRKLLEGEGERKQTRQNEKKRHQFQQRKKENKNQSPSSKRKVRKLWQKKQPPEKVVGVNEEGVKRKYLHLKDNEETVSSVPNISQNTKQTKRKRKCENGDIPSIEINSFRQETYSAFTSYDLNIDPSSPAHKSNAKSAISKFQHFIEPKEQSHSFNSVTDVSSIDAVPTTKTLSNFNTVSTFDAVTTVARESAVHAVSSLDSVSADDANFTVYADTNMNVAQSNNDGMTSLTNKFLNSLHSETQATVYGGDDRKTPPGNAPFRHEETDHSHVAKKRKQFTSEQKTDTKNKAKHRKPRLQKLTKAQFNANQIVVSVMFREIRLMECGDKYSTIEGQKCTVVSVAPTENLPFYKRRTLHGSSNTVSNFPPQADVYCNLSMEKRQTLGLTIAANIRALKCAKPDETNLTCLYGERAIRSQDIRNSLAQDCGTTSNEKFLVEKEINEDSNSVSPSSISSASPRENIGSSVSFCRPSNMAVHNGQNNIAATDAVTSLIRDAQKESLQKCKIYSGITGEFMGEGDLFLIPYIRYEQDGSKAAHFTAESEDVSRNIHNDYPQRGRGRLGGMKQSQSDTCNLIAAGASACHFRQLQLQAEPRLAIDSYSGQIAQSTADFFKTLNVLGYSVNLV